MVRVVVTGVGGYSPLGAEWKTVEDHLRSERNAIQRMDSWTQYARLNSLLAAPTCEVDYPAHYNRKKTRTMGPVSRMAVRATERALEHAGLLDDPLVSSGAMGVAYGSSAGSSETMSEFGQLLLDKSLDGLNATSYLRMMGHTTAVNIGLFFGMKGRIIPTSSACTAGSQGVGYAYEAIKSGRQLMMAAGGAEELCVSHTAVFDVLYATSTLNDEPHLSPRPYDSERDGLVIGEGAATLILEERDHAISRGATVLAEIIGYGTNSDGTHVTRPSAATMAIAMHQALDEAHISSDAIGYVNGHGTATEHGDIQESLATYDVFKRPVPLSSLKSYMGHTLGACGALEAWYTIEMMNRGWFAPTINLTQVDERCAELDYIGPGGRLIDTEYAMTNNFAFGGINTSIILRRV